MGHMIIACTRMSTNSQFTDEYQERWRGATNSSWMLFKNGSADEAVLVVRGCMVQEFVEQGEIEEAYCKLIGVIREAIDKSKDTGCQNWEKDMRFHEGVAALDVPWRRLFRKIVNHVEKELKLAYLDIYDHMDELYTALPEKCLSSWQKLMEG